VNTDPQLVELRALNLSTQTRVTFIHTNSLSVHKSSRIPKSSFSHTLTYQMHKNIHNNHLIKLHRVPLHINRYVVSYLSRYFTVKRLLCNQLKIIIPAWVYLKLGGLKRWQAHTHTHNTHTHKHTHNLLLVIHRAPFPDSRISFLVSLRHRDSGVDSVSLV
jgi:cytochrome c oxidase subunit IV